jgi:CubicO group peptidase (beta-lactamase class C family)
MNRSMTLLYFLPLSFLLLSGCSSLSDPYSAAIAEGRAAVREVMADPGAVSVSLALVEGDRLIWSEAFGIADRDADRKATTETIYGVCSVSKMLATAAVMILVDQGRISLNEPVVTYIPGFTMPLDSRHRNITVKMLLNHTSGLPGYDPKTMTNAPYTGYAADFMEGLKRQRVMHDPGTIAAYNNDGFTMVENLVKAVTGQDYPAFVRRNILTPLGMTRSQYQNVVLPAGSYAQGYNGAAKIPFYNLNVYASGGFFSTPEELSRLASMFANNGVYNGQRILSAQSVAAMAEDRRQGTFNPVPNESERFGLGWDTMAQPGLAAVGVKSWQKTGDLTGVYGTCIVVVPEEHLGVVVFGASGSLATSFGSSHAVKIAERILLRALVERGRIPAMPPSLSTDDLPLAAVPAADKGAYPGTYASSNGVFSLTYGAGDALSVNVYQSGWQEAYSNFKLRSDGWYAADGDPVTALRLLTASGRNYLAVRKPAASRLYSITTLFAQRLDAKPAISAAWLARVGERWLPVNKDLTIHYPVKVDDQTVQLTAIPGLTGYLQSGKILCDMTPPGNDRLNGMFLIMPDGVRGLYDAAMETWNAEQWLRLGSTLYRPQSTVPLLAPGAAVVTISAEEFAEWRRLPATGTISVTNAAYWALFDAAYTELASGTGPGTHAFAGAGAKYLVLCGAAGTPIVLNLL